VTDNHADLLANTGDQYPEAHAEDASEFDEVDEWDVPTLVGTADQVSSTAVETSGWPAPPHPDAYLGLAGDVVRTIEPYSEADPVALLVQTLAAFGNLAGRGPHIRVEADEHPGRLYVGLIGDSSRGRKGVSWGHLRRLFESVDTSFPERIASGLSSGEGLIDQVRDPYTDDEEPRDKRLLVVESELASALKVIERQGNTLSPVLRNAWDGTALRTLTRNTPAKATGTHISLIGHITIEELRRRLDQTEAANGFGNRFVWICVRRSKLLPEGASPPAQDLNELSIRLRHSLDKTLRAGIVTRTPEARALWAAVYGGLTEGRGGLAGTLTTRAEAQVTRLSLLYALLDEADSIGEPHLRAALALWDFSARSVVHVFGDSTGNPDADTILRALRATAHGLTRTEIRDLFGRNLPGARLDQALAELISRGSAHITNEPTGGRPTERWHYGKQP
jgi:hypothetical protein